MTADALLSRLDRVKRTRAQVWIARCPAHDDRGPSLSVRELDDGRVLVHCFAGCGADEIVSAAGLTFAELAPPRPSGAHSVKPERRPFPALDVLRCIAQEARIAAVAAMRLGQGHQISDDDRQRLLVAVERISAAVDLAEGSA
jgi:hypothetical protein